MCANAPEKKAHCKGKQGKTAAAPAHTHLLSLGGPLRTEAAAQAHHPTLCTPPLKVFCSTPCRRQLIHISRQEAEAVRLTTDLLLPEENNPKENKDPANTTCVAPIVLFARCTRTHTRCWRTAGRGIWISYMTVQSLGSMLGCTPPGLGSLSQSQYDARFTATKAV